MDSDRFEKQLQFILEIDKLKTISRRTYLLNAERLENTAEHSWHLAMLAILLAEHANEPVNVSRVIASVHTILSLLCGEQTRQNPPRVKYWEIIAYKLNSLNEAQL